MVGFPGISVKTESVYSLSLSAGTETERGCVEFHYDGREAGNARKVNQEAPAFR
jgi:hypothetical protein